MLPVLLLAHLDLAAQLTSVLESSTDLGSAIAGVVIACGFGAAHALSPGHGKTLVSAYLIGTKGTPQQAVWLGLTTSITHTLAIYLLGLIALFASQYLLPEQLYPYLSVMSGLAICVVGFRLLFKRLFVKQPAHTHSHPHHSDDTCAGCRDFASPPTDWSSLLTLGISSGLTPCPSALVLLLGAVAIHRIPFGLLLVGGFSVGLAFVLTGLGLLTVYASQWLERFPTAGGWVRQLPLASATFTICIGIGFTAYSLVTIAP